MMGRWFSKEKRDVAPGTDVVLAGLLARAAAPPCSINETAAARTAALCWARALSGATVDGAEISAQTLFDVGIDLVLQGESLHEISTTGGQLQLRRAASWTVSGPPDAWRYLIQRAGPDTGQSSRTVAAEGVVHCTWTTERLSPWRGIGPFAGASISARLLAEIENATADEMSGPVGHLLALPSDDKGLDEFKSTLSGLRGRTAIVEGGAWGSDDRTNVLRSHRIGSEPSQALPILRSDVERSVLACAGVPVEVAVLASGSGGREAWRRWIFGSVAPMAKLIEQELSEKLDRPVTLGFDGLRASDLAGRSRAYKQLADAGMDAARAAEICGFD